MFVFIPKPYRDLQFGARSFLAVVDSLEELEAYLALLDLNQLPFATVDADDDEAGAVGVTFEEVQAERSIVLDAVCERVVAQEVRPKVDVPAVPPKVALRSVPRLNTFLLCPQLQRPVTGQPSLVQPRHWYNPPCF